MTPEEMKAGVLMGDFKAGEVKFSEAGLFVEIQDLCLSSENCYLTTTRGSRIPLKISSPVSLAALLEQGGIVVVPLPGAFLKAVTA